MALEFLPAPPHHSHSNNNNNNNAIVYGPYVNHLTWEGSYWHGATEGDNGCTLTNHTTWTLRSSEQAGCLRALGYIKTTADYREPISQWAFEPVCDSWKKRKAIDEIDGGLNVGNYLAKIITDMVYICTYSLMIFCEVVAPTIVQLLQLF